VNGKSIGENCGARQNLDEKVIRPFERPAEEGGRLHQPAGNLFDSAIMKTSVISEEFRDRYLSNPDDPEAFEGTAVVFDGPEDYHARIDDPALENIDEHDDPRSCAAPARSAIRAAPRW
jgi:dihydroxy-acid dehydratase